MTFKDKKKLKIFDLMLEWMRLKFKAITVSFPLSCMYHARAAMIEAQIHYIAGMTKKQIQQKDIDTNEPEKSQGHP